jgi:large subunit ribosomal protein L15
VGVNVSDLKRFESGTVVSPETLLEVGLISRVSGNLPPVKILGDGELDKKLSFEKVAFSQSAREKIEKAGGSIE